MSVTLFLKVSPLTSLLVLLFLQYNISFQAHNMYLSLLNTLAVSSCISQYVYNDIHQFHKLKVLKVVQDMIFSFSDHIESYWVHLGMSRSFSKKLVQMF